MWVSPLLSCFVQINDTKVLESHLAICYKMHLSFKSANSFPNHFWESLFECQIVLLLKIYNERDSASGPQNSTISQPLTSTTLNHFQASE